MKILSIHSGHDCAAGVFGDFKLQYIYKEERLSRIKAHSNEFPFLSLNRLKQHVNFNEIQKVVLGRDYFPTKVIKKRKLLVWYQVQKLQNSKKQISLQHLMRRTGIKCEFELLDVSKFKKMVGLNENCEILFTDHHFAHSIPCLFYRPSWENCLLYTADGGGEGVQYSAVTYRDGRLERVFGHSDLMHSNWTPNSLGQIYGLVTQICGFTKNKHEGKITGLAAFGKPVVSAEIKELFEVSPDGEIKSTFYDYKYATEKLQRLYDEHGAKNLAASVQIALEDLILQALKILKDKYKFSQIGLAGGVFSNVSLNRRIAEELAIDEVFIFPAMTDDGLVIGRALNALIDEFGLDTFLKNRQELENVYWGEKYEATSEKLAVVANEFTITKLNDYKKVVHDIKNQKVVALFTDGMEYGPRALGARSILLSPVGREINDIVNQRLNRTEFMPFAPVVLSGWENDVFDIPSRSAFACKFMTITVGVKENWLNKIPAVVHIDQSARPQIIQRDTNPIYYDIINEFYQQTGIPVLVNTSFNSHDEPIIDTMEQAVNALRNRRIDALLIDNLYIE